MTATADITTIPDDVTATAFTATDTRSATRPARNRRGTLVRRIGGVVAATAAMMIGFSVANSASTAHADTTAGSAYFVSTVECGGDSLYFTSNSSADSGSFAKLWVFDPSSAQWVTDDVWVAADYYATYNIADLSFARGYYMVYVSYAQWNGYGWDFSGEYIDTYEQYYTATDHAASAYCYMGNDLSATS